MVAGGRRLLNTRLAFREQPGEEKRRLHLGTGDREDMPDSPKPAPGDLQRRVVSPVGPGDGRAHLLQRFYHSPHRSPSDRVVPRQFGSGRASCQGTQEEPDRGTGVPDVDRGVGRRPRADAAAI